MMSKNIKMPRIGAHVSAAGGLWNAILNAKKIGAEAVQLFGSSPRSFQASLPSLEAAKKFKDLRRAERIGDVFLHAPYLINLASENPRLRHGSESLLSRHLQIAESIGAVGVIFHLGSGKSLPRRKAQQNLLEGMKRTLSRVPGKTKLVMENSAGGGERIGATLEELGFLIKKINSPRVGVCFDTAHAFEAGLIKKYDTREVERLAESIQKNIGWKRLIAFHANDSKTPHASHNDRHENIGEGYIGKEAFRTLLHHPKFRHVPWLLEVPGFDGNGPDKKNINILKSLL